jgi:hypothetical protein
MRILQEMFSGKLISLRGDVEWPARSPDLTSCDFFLGFPEIKSLHWLSSQPRGPQKRDVAIPKNMTEGLQKLQDSRTVSTRTATTLQIQFLKLTKRNYTHNPSICNFHFFCIFDSTLPMNI